MIEDNLPTPPFPPHDLLADAGDDPEWDTEHWRPKALGFHEVELSARVLPYIQERLSWGKTLAREVAKRVNLAEGRVTTLLPVGKSEQDIVKWEWGGITSMPPEHFHHFGEIADGPMRLVPKPRTVDLLADQLHRCLAEHGDRVCVFENSNAAPRDKALRGVDGVFCFQKEVYHLVKASESTPQRIEMTIGHAESLWLFLGFLSAVQASDSIPAKRGRLRTEEIELIAAGVEKIVFGAFDGEGYLIWHAADGSKAARAE